MSGTVLPVSETEESLRAPWDAAQKPVNTVRVGERVYEWREYSTSAEPVRGWSHHGVVVGPGREGLIAASPDGRALVEVRAGRATRTVDMPVTECHGMSLDAYGDDYAIWIADNGTKFDYRERGDHLDVDRPGQVVRVDATGRVLQVITGDALPEAAHGWRPTGATSEKESDGGRIWVADGYGRSLVHCFSRGGEPLWTTDGGDSGLTFAQPHAILLDTRRDVPELLVADRANKRIVVLTTEGRFLRSYGEGQVTSPSGFALDGDVLWVTELNGAIVAFDRDDRLVATLGDSAASDDEGWPNAIVGDEMVRSELVPGVFRSPHGIAIDDAGVIAVTEWVIGGRLIVLTPRHPAQRVAP